MDATRTGDVAAGRAPTRGGRGPDGAPTDTGLGLGALVEWLREERRTLAVTLVGLAVVAVYVVMAMGRLRGVHYDVWGALLIGPALLALTVPLARRAALREDDPRLLRILLGATVLALAFAVVRYSVAFGVYDGVADAARYAAEGVDIATSVHAGEPSFDVSGQVPGTGTISVAVGLVFSLVGTTTLGAFMVFAWVGLAGRYLFYRAFRTALPEHDPTLYRLLIFFFPSLLFWPSSIGKEAWMLLALGMSTLGIARILRQRPRGYLLLVAGGAVASLVRPHLVLMVLPALIVAVLLRRSDHPDTLAPLRQAATLGVAVALALAAVQTTASFFEEEVTLTAVSDLLEDTEEHTSQGGSSFTPRPVTGPTDLPLAAVTVLFRPFPHEASTSQGLLAALEALLLLGLTLRYAPVSLAALRDRRTWPLAAVAVVYTLLFVIAFSRFGNFGLLARQRIQVLPFLFLLIALRPVAATAVTGRASGRPR